MARCAGWLEPAPRYGPLKEPAPGEIIIGVPPVSQLMTPDIRDTASRPAGLRPPGTPVSANPCAPASCAAVSIGPALHPGGQRPGTGNAANPNAALDPAPGSGIRHRTPEVSSRLSGHPDLQPEVPEPELEQAPAGQVHYPGQQDDDKDDQDNPDNGNHKAREYKSAYFSLSGNASRCTGLSGRPRH